MTFIDRVADRLSHEVRAERPHAEVMGLEQLPDDVGGLRVRERPVDLEVVTPQASSRPS